LLGVVQLVVFGVGRQDDPSRLKGSRQAAASPIVANPVGDSGCHVG
jgi:hypothetical protein